MAPVIGTYSSGTTSFTPGTPSGLTAGDLAFIVMESTDSTTTAGTPATTSAFTKLVEEAQPNSGTGLTTLTVFAKIWAGGDSLAVTGVGDHCSGYAVRIPAAEHNVSDVTTDLVVGTVFESSNSTVSPSGITVEAGSTILWCHSTTRDANATDTTFSNWALTDPSSLTEIGDQTVSTGAGGGVGVAYGTCAGTSTGSGSLTIFNANNVGVLLGIPPAAAAAISMSLGMINIGF